MRARTGLWEPWVGNDPGPPGQAQTRRCSLRAAVGHADVSSHYSMRRGRYIERGTLAKTTGRIIRRSTQAVEGCRIGTWSNFGVVRSSVVLGDVAFSGQS